MTHPTYSQQALSRYNLPRLKRITTELGVTPTGDKRAADTWVNAIITHQSAQTQKVADEQTTAQAELNGFIATQAQTVAPEKLTTVVCSFYDHEFYAGFELIATITHDDDLTQPWVVMVNGTEKFRANTWMRCYRFIQWHHQDGTLNEAAPAQTETLTETPCTLRQSDTVSLSNCSVTIIENEIMAQIFTEGEKYSFEILDDGIYKNDIKLGEVGQTDAGWWFTRATDATQQRILCDSAMDAVYGLSMVDTLTHSEVADYEEMLDRQFEMLTPGDWEVLREYAPVAESRELVTV